MKQILFLFVWIPTVVFAQVVSDSTQVVTTGSAKVTLDEEPVKKKKQTILKRPERHSPVLATVLSTVLPEQVRSITENIGRYQSFMVLGPSWRTMSPLTTKNTSPIEMPCITAKSVPLP